MDVELLLRRNCQEVRRISLELSSLWSAHRRERSESSNKSECRSWTASRIQPDHAGLREVNRERLVLHLVEQRDAVSVRIQRVVQ
jgi:hypothetical protein